MKQNKRWKLVARFCLWLVVAAGLVSPGLSGTAAASPSSPPAAPVANYQLFLPTLSTFSHTSTFGVEVNSISASGGLDQVRAAGTNWVRRNAIVWSQVEAVRGQRDWSVLAGIEAELKNAAQNNLQAIIVVRGAPAWAQAHPGSPCGPIRPDALPDFASFIGDLVKRYSGYPYRVLNWEILNEQDAPVVNADLPYGCWGNPNDNYNAGSSYADLLKVVYPAVKAANASAQVIVGGLLLDCDPTNPPEISPGQRKNCNASRYMEGVLRAGGGDYFDGVALHGYDYYQSSLGRFANPNWHSSWNTTGPVIAAKINYLQTLLADYQVQGKYLMVTEAALLCEVQCDQNFELTKGYYLVENFVIGQARGLRANIWYALYGWRNSNLLTASNTPLPAYEAYKFARQEIGSAQFIGEALQDGVYRFEFQQGGKRIWVVWSQDGALHPLQPPTPPTAAWDSFGQPLAVAPSMNITSAPVYLEWTP